MTGQVPAIPSTLATEKPVCSACGSTVTQPIDGRCNFCGERLHNADVTSEDHTPYAEARAEGRSGWRRMCRWVYGANRQRLRHLGLTRSSRPSRRFARINLLLLALFVGLAVFANSGWRLVIPQPGVLAEAIEPTGKGWWQIAASTEHGDALWWNAPWAVIAGVAAALLTTLVGSILLAVVARKAARAARVQPSDPPRLRCAMEYSTAWMHLLSLAMIVMIAAPLEQISMGLHWSKIPAAIFHVPAALVGIVGLLLWWFWTIRLGQTMPASTKSRVQRFFVVWMPMIVVLIAAGTVYGVWRGTGHAMRALNLNW